MTVVILDTNSLLMPFELKLNLDLLIQDAVGDA